MVKLTNLKMAGKKVVAVAASAVIATSPIFAAGIADFSKNIMDEEEHGKVIVGANGDDMKAAQLVFDTLNTRSEGGTMYELTAKKTASGSNSDSVSMGDKDQLNFGENIFDVRGSDFDDKDFKVLDDVTFKTGSDSEEAEQTIELAEGQGLFEYSLRDDFEEEISPKVWYDDGDVLTFTYEFKSPIDFEEGEADDEMNGRTIEILGTEYTVVGASEGADENGGENTITSLELMAGTERVTLGEGDDTEVEIDGKKLSIGVIAVSAVDVLVRVNDVTKVVDLYDTEEIGGISIGITELLESGRDVVSGYAEIQLGSRKIKLSDGEEVKLNERDLSDYSEFEDYDTLIEMINVNNDDQFLGFSLTYTADDEFILKEGDSWADEVFGGFEIVYNGIEGEEDLEEIKVSTSSEKVKLAATLENGENYSENIAEMLDKDDPNSALRLIGNSDDDAWLYQSITFEDDANLAAGHHLVIDADNDGEVDGGETVAVFDEGADAFIAELGLFYDDGAATINGVDLNNGADGAITEVENFLVEYDTDAATNGYHVIGINLREANGVRFLTGDLDDQALYEFKGFSVNNEEVDFTDKLRNSDSNDVDADEIAEKLDDVDRSNYVTQVLDGEDRYYINQLGGIISELALANEYFVDVATVAVEDIGNDDPTLVINHDDGDATYDEDPQDIPEVIVTIGPEGGNDDGVALGVDIENSNIAETGTGADADVEEGNSDVKGYADPFGTLVTFDNDEGDYVTLQTSNDQLRADFRMVQAGLQSSTMKMAFVSEEEAQDKKEELMDEGYTVTMKEVQTEGYDKLLAEVMTDAQADGDYNNAIIVGGPVVNSAALAVGGESTLEAGEASIKYYEDLNAVLIYGYSKEDTERAAEDYISRNREGKV